MTMYRNPALGIAAAALLLSYLLPILDGERARLWINLPVMGALTAVQTLALILLAILGNFRFEQGIMLVALICGAITQYLLLEDGALFGAGAWAALLATLLCLWRVLAFLSARADRVILVVVPVLFLSSMLVCWEIGVRGAQVSPVLLPAPSAVIHAFFTEFPTLWADAVQTLARSALSGYLMGSGFGFCLALLFDRFPKVSRAFMPYCTALSAVPMIGFAPIMVMWFGFGWESKAAVVAVVTFFPMLINTVTGLAATDRMQGDLMRSYSASYGTTLRKLKLPTALPFMMTALKMNSTFAIISAIVAEFFGTPVLGMGFRISAELARMNLDLVWATILMGALAGSLVYGGLSLAERATTFRHQTAHSNRA